ncbi:MAG: phosphatidate cytidylyltransferase, partial [Dokdonella sp.]
VIIAAMCLQALWEWTRLSGFRSRPLRAGIVIANAVALALLWLIRDQPAAWWVVGCGVVGWGLAMLWLRDLSFAAAPTRENAALKLAAAELAVLPAWLALMMLHAEPLQGHVWALFILLLIWMADTAAYFTGKRYGTTKLAPRISPNKTRAGAWGALIGGAVLAAVAGWLLDVRGIALVALIGLALLTVAASIVGDLIESLLKRQANVKDSGTLFPGHGGLLDRLDSLFAAIPVFVAGKALLDLVIGL